MAAATKTCTNSECACDNPQPLVNFGWSNRAKGYLRGKCKVCYNAASNQYKANNREAQQAYHQQYRQDHLEQIQARGRQYYTDNREAINAQQSTPEARAQQQQYRQDNREAIRLRMQQYYANNREAILAQHHTPEARALANAAAAVRRSTDEGKLLEAASGLHRLFYRGELGRVRLARAEAFVGCTRQQYRDWLASKFKPGMIHDNYGQGTGTWAPDHVIPKFAFKGEINEENLAIIYWHGNVQPLWDPENRAKGDYYTAEGKADLIARYNAWVAAGKPPPII